MRAIDLEARVITAVDQLRAGQHVEHDLIECKRTWPEEQKARQLAGSLNRAGGDPVIYIIGIDEKTGRVHDVSDVDILDWWNQIVPQFDHTPPELVRHLNVQVGEGGEHVVAVAIASDRAPYVVKTGKGNQLFEVPMREGTGTRSARRDELLRILIPTTRLPEVVPVEGNLYAEYAPKVDERLSGERTFSQEESLYARGTLRLYFAHNGREAATLPTHGMTGILRFANEIFPVSVLPFVPRNDKQQNPTAGPIVTRDGITITSSGSAVLALSLKDCPPSKREELRSSQQVVLDLELEVLGGIKPIRVNGELEKDPDREEKTAYQDILGNWSFKHVGLQE